MLPDRSKTYVPNRRRTSPVRRNRGFTLLELLLVLSILVVIGGIAMLSLRGAQEDAYNDATKNQLDLLSQAILRYQLKMNSLPDTLEALRDGPSDAAKKKKWNEPIMKEIPADAWGNSLTYTVNGKTYEIRSGGADGQVNTEDDIIVEG